MIGVGAAFGTKPGADPGLLRGSEPPPDAENFPPGAFVRFRNVLFSSSSKRKGHFYTYPVYRTNNIKSTKWDNWRRAGENRRSQKSNNLV